MLFETRVSMMMRDERGELPTKMIDRSIKMAELAERETRQQGTKSWNDPRIVARGGPCMRQHLSRGCSACLLVRRVSFEGHQKKLNLS